MSERGLQYCLKIVGSFRDSFFFFFPWQHLATQGFFCPNHSFSRNHSTKINFQLTQVCSLNVQAICFLFYLFMCRNIDNKHFPFLSASLSKVHLKLCTFSLRGQGQTTGPFLVEVEQDRRMRLIQVEWQLRPYTKCPRMFSTSWMTVSALRVSFKSCSPPSLGGWHLHSLVIIDLQQMAFPLPVCGF